MLTKRYLSIILCVLLSCLHLHADDPLVSEADDPLVSEAKGAVQFPAYEPHFLQKLLPAATYLQLVNLYITLGGHPKYNTLLAQGLKSLSLIQQTEIAPFLTAPILLAAQQEGLLRNVVFGALNNTVLQSFWGSLKPSDQLDVSNYLTPTQKQQLFNPGGGGNHPMPLNNPRLMIQRLP